MKKIKFINRMSNMEGGLLQNKRKLRLLSIIVKRKENRIGHIIRGKETYKLCLRTQSKKRRIEKGRDYS